MRKENPLTININGRLMDLSTPKVMGILNVTPDSFYPGSRTEHPHAIRERIKTIIDEGADIIDLGGCSTRPGFTPVSPQEEWERVSRACDILRENYPEFPLSIDTYNASTALKAIEKYNAAIINDVAGGKDPDMWPMISEQHVAYVLTHNPGEDTRYMDVTADIITSLSYSLNELYRLGVADVILDPGFGFSKTIDENFKIIRELDEIVKTGAPVLVGVSRKSMIYNTLGIRPEDSLWGTIALDAVALEKGADIIRVHDVAAGRQTVDLITKIYSC